MPGNTSENDTNDAILILQNKTQYAIVFMKMYLCTNTEWVFPTLFIARLRKWLVVHKMASITENKVRELVTPAVETLGFDLVDIEYKKEGGQRILYIYADRMGGITIDECEKISRSIEPILDQHDPIPESYYLCVSSPGIDRPFHNEADYRRNLGQRIEIKLYAPYHDEKDYSGILKSIENDQLTMDADGKEITFKLADIARARPAIEFK